MTWYTGLMQKGGTSYTPQAARIISFAGLVIPFILVAYGYLHAANIIVSKNFTSFEMLTFVSIIWMLIAVWQFLIPGKNNFVIGFRLAMYHILAAFYLLFITGILTPFAACWLLLLIAASVYFGRMAVLMSVAVFVLIVLADIIHL